MCDLSTLVGDTGLVIHLTMKISELISMYIEQAWEKCKHAKTCDETDDYSEKIDSLYDIYGVVSKFERSLINQLDVD